MAPAKASKKAVKILMPEIEKKYINQEKIPHKWCPGCSDGLVLKATAHALAELGIPPEKLVVVSGIGCAGRSAAFFECDSIHGLHGRALPLAEGVKRANPDLTVVVMSGDGDLKGIGGNHLIHSSRRDVDVTVVCFDNETYGLTGGQMSPTTPEGVKSPTSVAGNPWHPVNAHGIITSNRRYFYARSSAAHFDHLKNCIKSAIEWDGFAFVDTKTTCPVNYGRRHGVMTPWENIQKLKKDFKVSYEEGTLDDYGLGIEKQDYGKK